MPRRSPITTGVLLAAIAAIAFGVTTPVVAWAGRGLGPFSTAALLYLGAALAAIILRMFKRRSEAPLRRSDLPRVLAVALVGGAIAPTLLAWGLQRSGPTIGALLLNLEAVFTVLLARAFFNEPIGRRVALAVIAMVAGGIALTLDAWQATTWGIAGMVAVALATAAWATDNTLTRPLAERDPLEVVASKGGLGALITGIAAFAFGEPWPSTLAATSLLLCGATGYGLSLRLYLLAQRRIGAGRTGSVFALAPFVGAALAFAIGDRSAGGWTIVSAVLFALGVYLHVTERHHHRHSHDPIEHDHLHRHDDGHHEHDHDPPVTGEHSHRHHHDRVQHEHEHAPDLHHVHRH
ncbi:MAG: EamA family transporter [Deltaproteobacteria bacterium]|nr:EamA family transporter [Deltaproteobacteria bacterium]